jgi:hypothetical protein
VDPHWLSGGALVRCCIRDGDVYIERVHASIRFECRRSGFRCSGLRRYSARDFGFLRNLFVLAVGVALLIPAIKDYREKIARIDRAKLGPAGHPTRIVRTIGREAKVVALITLMVVAVAALGTFSPYVVLFRVPPSELFDPRGDGFADTSILASQFGFLLSLVVVVRIVLLARNDVRDALPNRGADVNSSELRRLTLRQASKHSMGIITIGIIFFTVTTITGALAVSEYAERLLEGDSGTTPAVLRFVVNPSPVCVAWTEKVDGTVDRPSGHVVRLAHSGSREVLVWDQRAWLVDSSAMVMASDC